MKVLLSLAMMIGTLPMVSCAGSDPDLDPQSQKPQTNSRQIPWNSPISGQGGGALGNLPQQQRR